MNESMIYLWTRLNGIWNVAMFGCVFFGIASVVLTVAYFVHATDEEYNKKELSVLRKFFPSVPLIWFVCVIAAVFVPTSKEYAMMKVLPKMANSQMAQDVQKDIPELYQMAKDALREMIKPKES